MSISISRQAYDELFEEIDETQQHFDPEDELDTTWKYPPVLGEGYLRYIQLRQGMTLEIHSYQHHDKLITHNVDGPHPCEWGIMLSGYWKHTSSTGIEGGSWAGQQAFASSGMEVGGMLELPEDYSLAVAMHFEPELLSSFVGNSSGELPASLQHLIGTPELPLHSRTSLATPIARHIAQQILHCPYQGMIKRVYLEGKTLELMALLLKQEAEIQTGNPTAKPLKPGTLERIHAAREVLLQRLDNPPSTAELAQQVNLNEYTLKQGFRQVFGKPLFTYLHDYRLEQARQLLETGEVKVTEVAQLVGFASRNHFAAEFRKKFGSNPKEYLIQHRRYF